MLGSSLEQPGVDGHDETLGLHLHDHLGLLVEEDLGEVTVEAKPPPPHELWGSRYPKDHRGAGHADFLPVAVNDDMARKEETHLRLDIGGPVGGLGIANSQYHMELDPEFFPIAWVVFISPPLWPMPPSQDLGEWSLRPMDLAWMATS